MTIPSKAFTKNPLFRAASRQIRNAARREFQRSTFGQLVDAVERTASAGSDTEARVRRIFERYQRMGPAKAMKQLGGGTLGEIVRSAEKYSISSVVGKAFNEFLGDLGPAGGLIRALMGPGHRRGRGGLERDLDTATAFLQSFGRGVFKSEDDMIRHLQSKGYQVTRPGEEPAEIRGTPLPGGVAPVTKAGKARKVIELPMAGGAKKRFRVDHPLVTGAMVPVPESSNVHSFGYDYDQGQLYVRFKLDEHTVRNRKGPRGPRPNKPGSLYQYSEVTPELFLDMLKKTSKGIWVWDNLRIRGTLSGHQKPYRLVGITAGYVPRKASLQPEGEWFLQRTMKLQSGRWIKSRPSSSVKRVFVSPLSGSSNGSPNRGGPNRGTPNRGR